MWCPPIYKQTPNIFQPVKTYIYQQCSDTECHLDNLPRVMSDGKKLQERVKGIHIVNIDADADDDDDSKRYPQRTNS